MTTRIVFSGYGGQGILTLGQIVASIALLQEKQVTWMPSYGAEMRGGTANCSVIISDQVIGSPIVSNELDILVAMNYPSIIKFMDKVKPGGQIYANASIVDREMITRDDVEVIMIDASNIAIEMGNVKVANMIMASGFLAKTDLFTIGDLRKALEQKFAGKKASIVDLNVAAVEKGLASI